MNSTFTSAWNCLSTAWCTWVMRLLLHWNNHTTYHQPWNAQRSWCPKSLSAGGLSFYLDLSLLLLFNPSLLFNQMNTNLINNIKFICTFFRWTLNTNFPIFNFLFEICYKMAIFMGIKATLPKIKGWKKWWKHLWIKSYYLERKSINNKIIFLTYPWKW